jgi:hypothetical protein
MTLTIVIPPELETRLKNEAGRLGVDEEKYVRQLIERSLSPAAPVHDQATLDLLAQWDAEDDTAEPAEIARRQQEWDEFRNSMNQDSLSGRPVYP